MKGDKRPSARKKYKKKTAAKKKEPIIAA